MIETRPLEHSSEDSAHAHGVLFGLVATSMELLCGQLLLVDARNSGSSCGALYAGELVLIRTLRDRPIFQLATYHERDLEEL